MSAAEKQTARTFDEKVSGPRSPYHYMGAGLPNVYLVGVTYRTDRATGEQSAGIPCLPALLAALAEALLKKPAALTPAELRYLRKRLGLASKNFAPMVGLSPEQYSRVENGAAITPMLDRTVRLLFAIVAKLKPEVAEVAARVEWKAEVDHEQKIIATQDGDQWTVQTRAA
jgi:DNA-binding transcriptional regulator YiaG